MKLISFFMFLSCFFCPILLKADSSIPPKLANPIKESDLSSFIMGPNLFRGTRVSPLFPDIVFTEQISWIEALNSKEDTLKYEKLEKEKTDIVAFISGIWTTHITSAPEPPGGCPFPKMVHKLVKGFKRTDGTYVLFYDENNKLNNAKGFSFPHTSIKITFKILESNTLVGNFMEIGFHMTSNKEAFTLKRITQNK